MHHQHSTDGEVRGNQDAHVSVLGQVTTYDVVFLIGETGGPDHGVNSVFDTPGKVLHHRIGMGEIDRDVGDPSRFPIVAEIQGGNQMETSGRFHRTADFGTHPPSGPEHGDLHVLGHDIPSCPPRAAAS
jgi:energy-coupling factor transport system ATP-binding protein